MQFLDKDLPCGCDYFRLCRYVKAAGLAGSAGFAGLGVAHPRVDKGQMRREDAKRDHHDAEQTDASDNGLRKKLHADILPRGVRPAFLP
jgi:hypothetical protein